MRGKREERGSGRKIKVSTRKKRERRNRKGGKGKKGIGGRRGREEKGESYEEKGTNDYVMKRLSLPWA